MEQDELDRVQYARAPQLDARSGLTLVRALLTAAPPEVLPLAKRDLARLGALADSIEAELNVPVPEPVATRSTSARTVRSWVGLHRRLDALGDLGDRYPRSARAATVRNRLFPEGTGYLSKSTYQVLWAESARRLTLIEEEKLEPTLEELAGAEFMTEIRAAHAEHGEAMGVTKAPELQEDPKVLPLVRELIRLIPQYAVKVMALYEADDPATHTLVRKALVAIDRHREAWARRADGSDDTKPSADATRPVVPADGPAPGPSAPADAAPPPTGGRVGFPDASPFNN